MTADLHAVLGRVTPAARYEVVAQTSSHPDRRLSTHLLGPVAEVCRWRREARSRAVVDGTHYTVRRIQQQRAEAGQEIES